MSKLRQEALALASLRAGRDLSGVQGDNSRTLAALKQNADNGTTFKPVNNGDHLRSTRQATDSLKRLMG